MLVSLLVKNFAIIDNIQIDFNDHMSVLTGETGAGKSLIIDAIGLLFGKRSSSDLVRFNENKATIEGVFSNYNEKLIEVLDKLDIPYDINEFFVIKREVFSNGKSICRINNNTITLSNLVEISEHVGDIHSQFDTQGLTNPKNYLEFIDDDDIKNDLLLYKDSLDRYKNILSEYENLKNQTNDDLQKIEFYKFQISEIEKAKLDVQEEIELKNRFNYLSNFENISTSIKEVLDIYNDQGVLDNMYNSVISLQKIEKFDEIYKKYREQIEESYYNLNDLILDLSSKFSNFDFDINELDEVNDRLALYSDLKRKYKKNTKELIEYLLEIKKVVNNIENFDDLVKELEKNTNKIFNETYEIAKNISNKRKEKSKILVLKMKESLSELYLKNLNFEIFFDENDVSFKKDGIDKIDFMVSFNKGEPMKSLSKIASGGELSRFMLALKSIISDKMRLQTLIFDEIDTGVSGAIAFSIANKIKSISKNSQVLCVTHLPQVAAIADNHYKISKVIDNDNRTKTQIEILTNENRVYEIAKMISNGEVTNASKNMAIELLKKSVFSNI